MRLGVWGGGVPEGPVGVIIRTRIVTDEYLAVCAVFAVSVKDSPVNDLAENCATVTLLGRDVDGINLDVFGGESSGESLFGLLLPSNFAPSHPEKRQGQDT